MKTSVPRLRSVRFKNGGEVIALNQFPDGRRAEVERHIREVLDAQEMIHGFAIVAWDDQGRSTCFSANYESQIPVILIPDFVRSRLLAQRIEHWTLEDMKR